MAYHVDSFLQDSTPLGADNHWPQCSFHLLQRVPSSLLAPRLWTCSHICFDSVSFVLVLIHLSLLWLNSLYFAVVTFQFCQLPDWNVHISQLAHTK
jgi:hypothetical protein